MRSSPAATELYRAAPLAAALLGVSLTLAACRRPPPAPPPEGNGSATLSWQAPTRNQDGSKLDGLAGYTIYYGHDPRALMHAVRVPDPRLTGYVVSGLAPGIYFFSVAAYTESGLQSGLSPPVMKIVTP